MHHFSSLENVSGTAKVVKNNGSSITLQFSNYKFEVSRSGKLMILFWTGHWSSSAICMIKVILAYKIPI